MTRRRASLPASLWTGIFLLLLGHVATEGPTTTTGPTRTTLSGLSEDHRGRHDNATVFHDDHVATTFSSAEEHTTRFAPRGTFPDQLERTLGSINDEEEEVPPTSEQSPSTATTGSNLHFMTGESTFATVPDNIHEIRRARVKNGGVPSRSNERKEITTLFSSVDDDDDDDDETNFDGARSTFISGLFGITDHVVPDRRTPSARASTAIPTSKTARLTFEKLGSLASEMANSDEGNSVGRELPSGAQPREEKKKKKKANEAEVAPPSLLNDTAVNYPKRVGVGHGKSGNRGAEVLWEYTDPVRRNESAENASERGATNAEWESSDDLDEERAVDDETTSPRTEEARTVESDDLDASSNGESPKYDDNRQSSSKETTPVTEPYSYGQSSTRESAYLSSTLKVSSSSETIFDDATDQEAYPYERNAVGGRAPHEGSTTGATRSSMSSAGLLNSETTATRDRQAETDDGPTITESYSDWSVGRSSHATPPASEYVATTAADPTEPYRHSAMTDSSVVASRSSEYTRGALPVATEETTRSTAEDSSYVRRTEGASSTTIEYEFVGLEETSESHSYATSTIESASSSYASSTSASTDGRVAFATNVTQTTRSSVASTNGNTARPEFDSASSASFYLHDENGTTIAGVWNSSTTSVAGDTEVPRASSSTASGSPYVEDTESSPASDSTETWLDSSAPDDLSDDPTVAPYVDTDDAPTTVELVDATDSVVVFNVTEPPVVLNVTEPPVVLNVTEPPVVPNVTDPPIILNITSPPIVLNVTDPPVVLNVTDPLVVLNVTDPPVVLNVTDPQIVFNVTDPPIILNITESPVVLNVTDPPVVLNITEPPVVFNVTDPPVVRGIDVTDPPASSAPTVDLPDASNSTTSASRWNVTDRSIGTDDAIETTAAESTTESALPIVTPPAERVTALVRIVFEGTWSDVCPRLSQLRRALAKLFVTGSDRYVSSNRIIFHQTQCDATARSAEPALTSVLVYVVTEDGAFDETTTEMLPDLYKTTPLDFPLTIRSFLPVQETDSGNAIAVVVVSCVAFVCLVLLAGLLFVMRKRQTRFNYGERCRPVSLDAYSVDSVSAYNSVIRKGMARASKRSYGNPAFEDSSVTPSHSLNFAGLSSFCSDVAAIAEEFSGIPQISANIDELPPGAEVKNRYANVVPLPETRVPLQRINGDPLTEYINASYVRGPKNAAKYYIACQAPMSATVTDFWRMIWEQQSKVIVMLTDVIENGIEKCVEYIPPSEVTDCHRLYGDYQVTLKKRETKEKYAISTLHLKNLENNTFREISHIWYLWPANGVPSDAAGLVAMLLETRALQRGGPGPIVVHCSPGTGRTGTLIALDLGIRQYEITRTVDVPRVVYTIRRDRAGAVQTKEQYAFIYKALDLYAAKLAGGALESM